MRNANLYSNNKGWTLTDWLSSEEVKKLQKAFKKKGYTNLAIVKNFDLKFTCYYVNGDLIFKRKIK